MKCHTNRTSKNDIENREVNVDYWLSGMLDRVGDHTCENDEELLKCATVTV